ncbi:MAG: cupin domain-containing protein [Thiovulaceae bacterium]|nr:cupin domain-containing protein [Sulfurimonadaceae bacterium]
MKYTDKNTFLKANVFGIGVSNDNYAQYFIGNSFLNFLVKPGEIPIFMANVTFEPGCRNNWHIHHAASGGGQVLICTAGEGWYQKDGETPLSLSEGSIVYIPSGVKHWHGAKNDSWFSHIAIQIPGTETSNEWLESVSDEYYITLHD